MSEQPGKSLVESGKGSIIASPQVTPATIQETVRTIALLQAMVTDILIRDVDYGRIPGTPQDSLWDPGASQIIGSFNCYCGPRRIVKLDDDGERLVACIEVPIISRQTQREVGSGIGAASTMETKYKYRWVDTPRQWGYDEEAIKTFKTKPGRADKGAYTTLYRIPNPEHSELVNTIIKMASKRAEVDAAEGLPGVASVLRQMFQGQPFKQGKAPAQAEYTGPRWQRFWGEVTRLGYTDAQAHAKLKVASMHDWLAKGNSLEEALVILRSDDSEAEPGTIEGTIEGEIEEVSQEDLGRLERYTEKKKEEFDKAPRDPETLQTVAALLRACNEDFHLQPEQVYVELNVNSAGELGELLTTKSAAKCYTEIAAVRK